MTTSVSGIRIRTRTRTDIVDPDAVDTDAVETSILGDPTSAEDAGPMPQFDVRR